MDVSDPQNDAHHDDEEDDQGEDKESVASALTSEIARGGIDDALARSIVFHAPDGRFGGLGVGGRWAAGLLQLLG
jgi:hypothetical protein